MSGRSCAAIAGTTVRDLTIEPASLEEAFLEYYADDAPREPRPVRPHLARQPAAAARSSRSPCSCGARLLPIIYDAFGEQFEQMMDSRPHPGGVHQVRRRRHLLASTGSVALGFVHPIAVGLNLVFAVGFAAAPSPASGSAARWRCCSPGRSPAARRVRHAGRRGLPVRRPSSVAGLALGRSPARPLTGRVAELGARQPAARLAQRVPAVRRVRGRSRLAASVSFDRLAPAHRHLAGGRARVVLPRCHRLAVAGRRGPPAVLAVPLPRSRGRPRRAARCGATSRSSAGSSSSAVAYALVVFPRRDLAAPS